MPPLSASLLAAALYLPPLPPLLVMVLEIEIYIYDISNMKVLHVIETTSNPEGANAAISLLVAEHFPIAICALSLSSNPS